MELLPASWAVAELPAVAFNVLGPPLEGTKMCAEALGTSVAFNLKRASTSYTYNLSRGLPLVEPAKGDGMHVQ